MLRRAVVYAIPAAALGAVLSAQLSERPLEGARTHPAIQYATRPTHDPVARLVRQLDEGSARLTYDDASGYLRSVLDALHVPVASQMLVMSKTGVQGLHTDPSNPRAIYFNDSVTVGYIRGAPLLELAVQDPEQGVILYTVDQKPQPKVAFDRPSSCLRCHQALSTLHVPGLLFRSSFIAPDGLPLSQFGSYDADDRTPFRRRFGGWYVTGTHGALRHMGNAIVRTRDDPESAISEQTLNRTSLDGAFDARGYPSAHSDIAALLVFEHQSHMTNLITRIGWEARIAAHDGRLDISSGPMGEAIGELVDYALFTDAAPLISPVRGTSDFAEWFSKLGPFDRQSRSLRQLDLERRLLKYPCSYMVYSPAFGALLPEIRQAIVRRMLDRLSDGDPDHRATAEILRETLLADR